MFAYKSTLFTLLFLFTVNIYSQANLDSLMIVWHDENQPDTIRLHAIKDFCLEIVRSYPDSTLTLVNEMLKLSKDKGLEQYEAEALLLKGRAYSYKGDLKLTEESYTKSQ